MTSATATVGRIDSRLQELHAALQTKAEAAAGFENAWQIEDGGGLKMEPETFAKFEAEMKAADSIKSLIDQQERLKKFIQYGSEEQRPKASPAELAQKAREDYLRQLQGKSLASAFMDSDAYKNRDARDPRIDFEYKDAGLPMLQALSELEAKDMFTAAGGNITLPALTGGLNIGLVERPFRQDHIRDLFPKESTTQTRIYAAVETGWTNNAAQVPTRVAQDGGPATGGPTDTWGVKPKSDIQLTVASWDVAVVAHLIDVHKTMLDDVAMLRSFLNRRMIDGLRYAEDVDFLYSTGGPEKITGLFHTPGVQVYTGRETDQLSAQVRRAITRVMLAEYAPTGIVLSPLDWESLELEEDKTGKWRISTSVAVGAEQRMWRLPVIATNAMNQGQYLVGAFGTGAQVYDREQVNVVVSTENKDNFEKNVVTFRAEERTALVVPRPESFVIGTFTDYDPDA